MSSRQTSGRWLTGLMAALVFAVAGRAADTPSLELVQTIVLKGRPGKLDHLVLDAKNQRLFVANKANNTLDVVDLKEGKLLRQIRGQQGVQGLAYADDLDRVFAGLGEGGFCNVFDGKSYKLLKTIKFADDADNVRYHPGTGRVYVAHAEKSLGVIDAKNFKVYADIKLPGAAEGFQLEKSRPRLYLNTPSPSELLVIDTEKNEVVERYPLKLAGANYTLALSEADHRLFIGCRKPSMVVVMDSESGKEITSVAIPGEVDDLFFDAKRKCLYAACGEGFLAVIRQGDADHLGEVEKIPTVKDARTAQFDPESGRLFLLVPRQEGKEGPEVRVYKTP